MLNNLDKEDAKEELLKCCFSTRWAEKMTKHRPYRTPEDVIKTSDEIWTGLKAEDWMEAFSGHPKIGDKVKGTEAEEQSGIKNADTKKLEELAELNKEYEKKFGYIFIICASGKSADEMIDNLRERIKNNPQIEMLIAAEEQNKITKLRLSKILWAGSQHIY